MRTLFAVFLALAAVACRSSSTEDPVFEVRAIVIEGPASLADGLRGGSAGVVVPSTRAATLQLTAGAELSSRPRILTREGARAEIANSQKVEYVQDLLVGAQGVLQPVRGEVEEGLWIAVTPSRADGGGIELEYEVRTSDVLRPIRSHTVRPAGADREGTIELIEVESKKFASNAVLGPNESVAIVLDAPARGDERRVRIIVLACDLAAAPAGE